MLAIGVRRSAKAGQIPIVVGSADLRAADLPEMGCASMYNVCRGNTMLEPWFEVQYCRLSVVSGGQSRQYEEAVVALSAGGIGAARGWERSSDT